MKKPDYTPAFLILLIAVVGFLLIAIPIAIANVMAEYIF